MCTDDTFDTYESPDESASGTYESPEDGTPGWSRRTFLKAAALGTAAAALLNRGGDGALSLGSVSALADNTGTDLLFSGFQCTAGDVTLVSARTVNEPCNCTPGSTGPVDVEFTLKNTATSARSCIVLHLCPTTYTVNGQTFTFDPDDVILPGVIQNQETKTYTATIQDYPCGVGTLCFGPVVAPKGRCTGCCSTISYNVPGDRGDENCPNPTPTSSKCKHQQICIQGRGATLTCTAGCAPSCGGTATLQLCGTGGTKPYTFSLSDGTTTYTPSSVSSDGNCATFNVAVTASKTFTGTVTGTDNCGSQSNSVPVTVTNPTVSLGLGGVGGSGCCNTGTALVFTATPGNCTGTATYAFKVDGHTPTSGEGSVSGNTFTYTNNPDGACHTVSVTVTCGGCESEPASKTVRQCINTDTNPSSC